MRLCVGECSDRYRDRVPLESRALAGVRVAVNRSHSDQPILHTDAGIGLRERRESDRMARAARPRHEIRTFGNDSVRKFESRFATISRAACAEC